MKKFLCILVAASFTAACAPTNESVVRAERSFRLETRASTLAGWSFVLDPGHGGPERGSSARIPNASAEADLNLAVGLTLRGILESLGADVTMTRTYDVPSADTILPLAAELRHRADHSLAAQPDFYISIHHNASKGPKQNRVELYYKLFTQGPARELAREILAGLSNLYPRHDTALITGNFAVLRENAAEAVLVECTYLSDPDLSKRLETYQLLKREAEAIAEGIVAYCRGGKPEITIAADSSVVRIAASDHLPLESILVEYSRGGKLETLRQNLAAARFTLDLPAAGVESLDATLRNSFGRSARLKRSFAAIADTRPVIAVVCDDGPAAIKAPEHFRLLMLKYSADEESVLRDIEATPPRITFIIRSADEERITHYFRSTKGGEIARKLAERISGAKVEEGSNYLLSQTSSPCLSIRTRSTENVLNALFAIIEE